MPDRPTYVISPRRAVHGVRVRSGRRVKLVVSDDAPVGRLAVTLIRYGTDQVLPGVSYTAEGHGATYEGTTGAHGTLRHHRVPSGYYVLTIDGHQYTVPTLDLDTQEAPVHLWIHRDDDRTAYPMDPGETWEEWEDESEYWFGEEGEVEAEEPEEEEAETVEVEADAAFGRAA